MQQPDNCNNINIPRIGKLPYGAKNRVAKCHGYGGYIRVKKLEGLGKKSGRLHSFAKSRIVLGKFEQLI